LSLSPDSQGNIVIPELELGLWQVNGKIEHPTGDYYRTFAQFELNENTMVSLRYFSYAKNATLSDYFDVLIPLTKKINSSEINNQSFSDATTLDDYQLAQDLFLKNIEGQNILATDTSNNKNAKMIGVFTRYQLWDKEYEFTLPDGVESFNLTYSVSTNMWQYFGHDVCLGQWNDSWELSLQNNNGSFYYAQKRGIYSQLYLGPILKPNPDGASRAIISEVFNVSHINPKNRTFKIKVDIGRSGSYGSNCRWSMVLASINYPKIKLVKVKSISSSGKIKYPSEIVSIPKLGNKNVFNRSYDLTISKAENTVLSSIDVYLMPPESISTPILVNSYDFMSKEVINLGGDVYRVPVTFKLEGNKSNLTEARFRNFKYQFIVNGFHDNQEVNSQLLSGAHTALWAMPEKVKRFGWTRDKGGDDWSSKGAYAWLENNFSLITRVNDISGEHGRNIGHKSHKYGTDIDTFQFTELDNKSGQENYNRLQRAVSNYFVGNTMVSDEQKHLDIVKIWVSNQRAGLDALSTVSEVQRLYSGYGSKYGELSAGWLYSLMINGNLTIATKVLETGLGSWEPSNKMKFNNVHNNHDHITLDPKALILIP